MLVERRGTMAWYIVTVLAVFVVNVLAAPRPLQTGKPCEVPALLDSGWVCGVKRVGANKTVFASFLGVPYAAQPVGERRFSELQPVETWCDYHDASTQGPICPQNDIIYGKLLNKSNMNEACIYANVHVPIEAVPDLTTDVVDGNVQVKQGLPIMVFVHGGGFSYGSGSPDLYGAEYMMREKVIIFTFNYRLNVFGFLSLNSSSIPGNNGLRDAITFLKWVRANAKAFGGDPDNITLGGQSAGACLVHLLTLSPAAKGLFRKAILMSGTAIPGFYNSSPKYAKYVADLFLSNLGVNATDPEVIHQQLINMPVEEIREADRQTQDTIGVTAFHPVIETPVPGFTTVLDTDPEILLAEGFGKDIPLLVGFTNKESESFRPNFEILDVLNRIKKNPTIILSPKLMMNAPQNIVLELANMTIQRYFNGTPTLDKYAKSISDTYFVQPAIKLAEVRTQQNGAPLFLYRYDYTADFSVIKEALGLRPFEGAAHIEDMTFVFKANIMKGTPGFSPRTDRDLGMVNWMTGFVRNFVYCSDPVCNHYPKSKWPAENTSRPIRYQRIEEPTVFQYTNISKDEQETVEFFESLQKLVDENS